jgi:hypothetical protein
MREPAKDKVSLLVECFTVPDIEMVTLHEQLGEPTSVGGNVLAVKIDHIGRVFSAHEHRSSVYRGIDLFPNH